MTAGHLLRLHDHGATYSREGRDPWAVHELFAMVFAMENSLPQASHPGSDSAAETERRRTRNAVGSLGKKHDVRACPGLLEGLARQRDVLEAAAAEQKRAVVDLPAYGQWRRDARSIGERTRTLLNDPECRPIFGRWPEHARLLQDKLQPLEARLREDDQVLQQRKWKQMKQEPSRAYPHHGRRRRRRQNKPSGSGLEG